MDGWMEGFVLLWSHPLKDIVDLVAGKGGGMGDLTFDCWDCIKEFPYCVLSLSNQWCVFIFGVLQGKQ